MGRVRHPLPRAKTRAPETLLLLVHVCGVLGLGGHSPWSSVQHHGMLRVQGHSLQSIVSHHAAGPAALMGDGGCP